MKKEKDEQIDSLFKNGLEDPVNESAFRDDDWGAMEQMLDKSKKRSGLVYWLPIMAGAAALVLLFLGWLFFRTTEETQQQQNQVVVAPHGGGKKTDVLKKNDTGISGGAVGQTADSSKQKIQNNASYAKNPEQTGHGPKTKTFLPLSAGGARREIAGQKNNAAIASNNSRKGEISDQKEVGTVDGQKLPPAGNNPTAAVTTQANPETKEIPNANVVKSSPDANSLANAATPEVEKDKKDVATVDAKSNQPAANTVAAVTKPTVKNIAKTGPASHAVFALSAIASSDMNGVNSFQGSRVGGNFGAMASMTIKKWTISTGAMYSIKPYQESYADYHTSYVFQNKPSSIGVNCKMIDIPVNVNYQVYHKGANKITVGSGLSSYIILREDYNFKYDNSNYAGPSGYSLINKNRNLLGILNLDATYEHQINSNVGITLQPYVKLPFTSVGASQAKLQSAGIAVSLNWNINPFIKQK